MLLLWFWFKAIMDINFPIHYSVVFKQWLRLWHLIEDFLAYWVKISMNKSLRFLFQANSQSIDLFIAGKFWKGLSYFPRGL